MIFIFSMPRSGSTWLGKIFDSHPEVFYLHEPAVDDRGLDLFSNYWFAGEPEAGDLDRARQYLERLTRNRSLRATGTRPFFRKTYRGSGARLIRTGIIYLGKGLERTGAPQPRIRVPDYRRRGCKDTLVIKSVSSMGLAQTFVRACGESFRPILLLRHPCSYVASMRRGNRLGLQPIPGSLGRLVETRSAIRYGASPTAIAGSTDVERLAWNWLLQNTEAHNAIAPAGITVRYEELAAHPVEATKTLFERLGLSWTLQTESFLARAQSRDGSYYATYRQAGAATERWRDELRAEDIARIENIVTKGDLGSGYFHVHTR